MAGKMKVVTSHRMEVQFFNAIAWCQEKFGEATATRFYDEVEYSLELLEKFPYLGKFEFLLEDEPLSYRSLVVYPYYKLIYYVEEPLLYVVALWDTRREPRALKKEIRD